MRRKRTIRDLDVTGKRALVRVDFDVPIDEQGTLIDDSRIRAALPTIRNLLNRGAAVVLMSHLGHPSGDAKTDEQLKLVNVAGWLGELLSGTNVTKCDEVVGPRVEQLADGLRSGEVLLLENLRFHPGETSADEVFASQLRQLGDFYVNDAFATCHRKHASTYLVPQLFPQGTRVIGMLLEDELRAIGRVLDSPRKPLIAILGGVKVSDKLGLVEELQARVDRLLIGGAMAYTFLEAKGFSMGASLVETDKLQVVQRLLNRTPSRFILPTDHVVGDRPQMPTTVATTEGDIEEGWIGMDIGPLTIESFCRTIAQASTVIWNGSLGRFEDEPFRKGTEVIARAIADSPAVSLVGGGETAAAVEQLGLTGRMTHVSTGGGAFLTYLEHGTLPALSVIDCCEQAEQDR